MGARILRYLASERVQTDSCRQRTVLVVLSIWREFYKIRKLKTTFFHNFSAKLLIVTKLNRRYDFQVFH